MTSLTVNGSAAAATTLAAAGKMFNTTGGTSGSTTTKISATATFRQIFAKGTTTATSTASIPAPTDSNFAGWMWDVTTLEGQRIAAGTWTPTIHLVSSSTPVVTPTVQWFKRSSAGVYTSIGSVTGSSITLSSSAQLLVFTAPSLAQMDFATGDKLVMWLWVQQTSGGATNATIGVTEATSGSTAGVTSEAQAVTPGYAPIPVALSVTMTGVGTLTSTLTAFGFSYPTDGYFLYDFISPDAGSSVWGPRLDQIAAGGFKLVNNYAILAGSTANMQAYINYAASVGLKVIISLELVWHSTISTTFPTLYTESGNQSTIAGFDTYVVNAVKGLAGTWGYYVADEPGDTNHSTVLSHFQAIQTADNTKPCLLISTGDLSTGTTFWGQNCVFFDCCTVGGDSHYNVGLTGRSDDPATVAQGTQTYCASKSIQSATILDANNATTGVWPTLVDQVALVSQTTAHMQAQTIGWYAYHSIWGSSTVFAGSGPFSVSDNPTLYWANLTSAIAASPSSYDRMVMADTPLKFYPLDDPGYGTHLNDLAGTDQTAGQTALTRTTGLLVGEVDGAMSFVPASLSAVSLPTTGLPSGSHAHSLECWCTLSSVPGGGNYPIMISLGTNTTNEESAIYFNGDAQRIALTFYGTDVDALAAPVAGTTYHVVGTYDGTTMQLYINGMSQGTLAHTPNITYGVAAIGKDGGGNFFGGVISKATIYGYALSSTQVMTHYIMGTLTSTFTGAGTLSGTLSTSSGGGALSATLAGVGTLTGTAGLTTALTSTFAEVGTLSGTTTLKTALAVSLAGVGTLTGTLSLGAALSTQLSGIGQLSPTLSAALSLPSATLVGVGTLTATPAPLTTALTATLAGVGTQASTFTLTTALTMTIAGVGTLTGTAQLSTALTTTLAGVGTLSGTLSLPGGGVSLSCTLAGVGMLSGTSSLATALSTTMVGTGTITGTITAKMALTATVIGAGTLTSILTAQTALISTLNGAGTLAGVFSLRVALFLTFAGMGTLILNAQSLFTSGPVVTLLVDQLVNVAQLTDVVLLHATIVESAPAQAVLSEKVV